MNQTLPAVHDNPVQAEPEGQPVEVLPQEDNLDRPGPTETTENHVAQKKSLDPDDLSMEEHIDQTQKELQSVFAAEIAHGDIKLDQLGDQLIVKLKKRALFSSGQSDLHAKGLTVLRRASDVFKSLSGKHIGIRIEGYTPFSPASTNLQERVRFQSNWMLSGERAIAVIQYLTEKGGVPASNISAVGFAVRPGTIDRGKQSPVDEPRIHIGLYPKHPSVAN
jgi:chemotaxis protein MotB